MINKTLKLIKLWKLLQVVDSLKTRFGDIKLSKCESYIEKESTKILDEINNSPSIKNKQKDSEQDIIAEKIEAVLNRRFRKRE